MERLAVNGSNLEFEVRGTGEPEVPELPPSSRWGRLWTVMGTWALAAALWAGASLGESNLTLGLICGLLLASVAAVLLLVGIRQWLHCDREWLPAMDEFFEGDPGPRFIPFGPYLVVGTLVAMFVGRTLIEWYAAGMSLPLPNLGWD